MQWENEVQHVFLVGAKSLGAYGGYETFALKLGFQTSISLREVLGIISSADTENEVY